MNSDKRTIILLAIENRDSHIMREVNLALPVLIITPKTLSYEIFYNSYVATYPFQQPNILKIGQTLYSIMNNMSDQSWIRKKVISFKNIGLEWSKVEEPFLNRIQRKLRSSETDMKQPIKYKLIHMNCLKVRNNKKEL